MKEYFDLAVAGGGRVIVTIFTIAVVLMFIAFLVVFLVLDYKNTKVSELRKKLYNNTSKHEKYEVTTVYSDKSKNYSGTEILPVPTKEPTKQYNFEFIGWDKNNFNESGDVVAKPIFYKRLNKLVVNFYLDDKTTLLKTVEVKYGKSADAGDLSPTKAETDEFSFEFDGWDKDISCVTEDESVYAVFKATPKKCHYKFVDSDDTILFEETAVFGTPIVYNDKPVSKDKNKVFSYFENYTLGQKLEKDETFTAVYKDIENEENENAVISEENENLTQNETLENDKITEEKQISNENEISDSNESVTELQDIQDGVVQEKTANLDENSLNLDKKQENLTENAENNQNDDKLNYEGLGTNIEKEEDSYFRKNYNSNYTFFDNGYDENEDDEVVEEIGASRPSYIQKSSDSNAKNNENKNENILKNDQVDRLNSSDVGALKNNNGKGHLFNVNFANRPAGASPKTETSYNSNNFGGLSGVSSNLNVDGHSKQNQTKQNSSNSKQNFRFGQFGGLANVSMSENVKNESNLSNNQNVASNKNTIKKVKDGVTIEINVGNATEQKPEEKKSMVGFEKLRNSNSNSQKVVYSNINKLVNDSQKQTKTETVTQQLSKNKNYNNGTRLNNFSSLYSDDGEQKTQNNTNLVQNQAKKPQKPHGTFTIFTGEEISSDKPKIDEKPVSYGTNATMRKNYFTDTKITGAGFKNEKFESKTNERDNVSNYFESVNRTETNQNASKNKSEIKLNDTDNSTKDIKEENNDGAELPQISVAGARLKTEQARQITLKNQSKQPDIESSKDDEDLLFGTILLNHKKKK